MEELITTLVGYTKIEYLHPTEQILMTSLVYFEELLPDKYDDSLFEKYEKVLLQLFMINKGNLSCSCSTRIGSCLLALYQKTDPPKIWNLITMVVSHPNPSIIYATGYIVDKIGVHVKSMIPGLVQKLLGMTKDLMYPSTYALCQCFKRDHKGLQSYLKKSLSYAKKGFHTQKNESLKLISLKLYRTLRKCDNYPSKQILTIIFDQMKNPETVLIYDQCSYTASKIIATPIINLPTDDSAESDFGIHKNTKAESAVDKALRSSFAIFREHSEYFPSLLYHFLNLLNPQIICKKLPLLFKLVRTVSQEEVYQLMSLFGPDVKKELFSVVSKENPPSGAQLSLLMDLNYDFSAVRELAALALQLSSASHLASRKAASNFFKKLAEKYPEHASLYLETSMLYLATPPEDNPTIEQDLRGFSLIASSILAGSRSPNFMANKVAKNISIFLDKALGIKNVFNTYTASAFKVMTYLPSYMIKKDLVANVISQFTKSIQGMDLNALIDGKSKQIIKRLSTSICTFLSVHNNNSEYSKFSQMFVKLSYSPFIRSKKLIIAIIKATPKIISKKEIKYLIMKSIN
ncbi:hypothetical protein GPJ56_007789 [Histomonas meleagridis]|uniref:uncharacterized protein n=1 Tax=Histomonas meleagridis TaxID=135588 RepID=UPI0035594E20|nr:hypothetical protein GPJ56_007789 [Histomonas meleagridis]KAH0798732.1 hypothetical protein GO595_008597 [Histomonas meleagridis]